MRNGSLQVIDVKSVVDRGKRLRIYDTHVMQLSVYAYLLRHTQKKKVSKKGIIRFSGVVNQDVAVELYGDAEIEAAYWRYNDLLDNNVVPKKASNWNCKTCKYQDICDY